MGDVDWIPALAALAVGLVGGAIATWRMVLARRTGSPAEAGSPAVRDLDAKTDSLFRQLGELDLLAEKRTSDQLARERYALELEAARALRDLARTEESVLAPAAAATAAATARPGGALRGFLWGTCTMTALGLLFFFVNRSANERQQGGSVTGGQAGQAQPAPSQADPELVALQVAVANAPADTEARLDLARAYLARQDLMAVWNETKVVLEHSPDEPRALAYQGLVRLAMGQGDLAVSMVERAVAGRPDFLEGYVHLAIVYSQTGRSADANATIEKAIRLFPEDQQELRSLWSRIQNTAAADESAELSDPHATVAPPATVAAPAAVENARATASTMAPAPNTASASGVTGTVDLDPGLAGQGGGVLFVMLRPAGATAGPPIAARRIVAPSFPVSFHIGPEDSMMGIELPDQLRVEARLDADGDPTTREPSDPAARMEPVQNGATGIGLVLRRP